MNSRIVVLTVLAGWMLTGSMVNGEVVSAGDGGFQIRIQQTVAGDPASVYRQLTGELGQWWDPQHTWSGDAANLAMDFERGWMVEKLANGGWCRHMDIVYHEPGKTLGLAGGLGPLREMGLHGALTFKLTPGEDGQTKLDVTFNVAGYSPEGLQPLAPVVDMVLGLQIERLKAHAAKAGN
jgi:uncharacterized protein YndB with AHSA1/START domain